jgi:hypothetical protein
MINKLLFATSLLGLTNDHGRGYLFTVVMLFVDLTNDEITLVIRKSLHVRALDATASLRVNLCIGMQCP